MEFLQELFGQEALTFGQFCERLAKMKGVKLANLASGEYVGVQKFWAALADRDGYKGEVKALSATVAKLQSEAEKAGCVKAELEKLQAETAQMQAAHRQALETRDFNDLVSATVRDAKGRNVKAVAALLDLDALQSSQNQKQDIAAAVAALRESDGYLFENTVQKPLCAPGAAGGTWTRRPVLTVKLQNEWQKEACDVMIKSRRDSSDD